VPPPFIIRETKPPTDDVKMSFRFTGKDRFPRVNVFQEGKINILGADTFIAAEKIYHYFEQLFTANWPALVCLQPRRDNERRELTSALRAPPTPAPTVLNALSELERALVEIADEDIDALITEYCA
jgi:hypothetical protein